MLAPNAHGGSTRPHLELFCARVQEAEKCSGYGISARALASHPSSPTLGQGCRGSAKTRRYVFGRERGHADARCATPQAPTIAELWAGLSRCSGSIPTL